MQTQVECLFWLSLLEKVLGQKKMFEEILGEVKVFLWRTVHSQMPTICVSAKWTICCFPCVINETSCYILKKSKALAFYVAKMLIHLSISIVAWSMCKVAKESFHLSQNCFRSMPGKI